MNLSEEEIQSISKQVISQLNTAFDLKTMTVNLFLPIARFQEIDLTPLLRSSNRGKLVVNKSDFENNTLLSYAYSGQEQISVNPYGIPEPKYGEIVDAIHLDLVLVPLLAFNNSGFRVGYGKGFYDTFLSKCNTNCLFVGVNHFDDSIEISDIETHDVALHYIVTPNRTMKFL
jgi:5-formyltetrahydrofolate cyclo-ligase